MTAMFVPISAGLAYAGVAVDGNEGEFAVGGGNNLMARDAAFGHGGEHSATGRIDDGQTLRAFFGDEEAGLREAEGNKAHNNAEGNDCCLRFQIDLSRDTQ